MRKPLTVILIFSTIALLAWFYWLQEWHRIVLVNPVFILTAAVPLIFPIAALILWHRGRLDRALLGAAIGFSVAALGVAVALFQRTETGHALIWRMATAVLG